MKDINYILENISSFNEEELKSIILSYIDHDSYNGLVLIPYINNDEILLEIIKMLDYHYNYLPLKVHSIVIKEIHNDKLFLDIVSKYQDMLDCGIYKRFLKISDEVKMEYILKYEGFIRFLCILSLQGEEKFDIMDEHFNQFELDEYAKCLSEPLQLEVFPYLESELTIYNLALKFYDDKHIASALKHIDTEELKTTLIQRIKNVDTKVDMMKIHNLNDGNKYQIISRIENASQRRKTALKFFYIEFDTDKKKHIKTSNIINTFDALPEALKFGVEIECVGENSFGIRAYSNKLFGYDVKKDDSIPQGVEFSSPKLSWKRQDLLGIYEVCRFIHSNKLESNDMCGGHIHFSAEYLNSYDAWFWLMYLYSNFEMEFYLISNREGSIPRSRIMNFAKPISGTFIDNLWRLLEASDTKYFIDTIQRITFQKERGLNLSNVFKKLNTIEFRIPNGETSPDRILENILLFGNLIVLSKKLSMLPLDENTYKLIHAIDSELLTAEERLELFLKLMFKDQALRDIFIKRYKVNSKKYLRENKYPTLEREMKTMRLKKTGIII